MAEPGKTELEALRSARRRNRIATIDRFDAFYKAYVTAIFSALVIYSVAGYFGDAAVTGSALEDVEQRGPAVCRLVAALALGLGLRSGARGGPLAFERADVRHALLSPVPTAVTLGGPATRQLRYAIFSGAVLGGAAGLVALRRLPELPALWLICGVLFGAVTGLMSHSAAMVVSGWRLRSYIVDAIAALLLVWCVADLITGRLTSPLSWLGSVAVWPLAFDARGVLPIFVALVLAVLGLRIIPKMSIEAAERRSRLVGQLRFAATLQDVRTVMVIQRQLSQDHLRARPYLRIGRGGSGLRANGLPRTRVYVRRSLHGFLRWSPFRLMRLLVLSLAAGFAICGGWAGTGVLFVVAGLCFWLVALDLIEPVAQDVDRPDAVSVDTEARGRIRGRLLIVPIALMLLCAGIASGPALVLGPDDLVAALWLPLVMSATCLGMGGAALAVVRSSVPAAGMVSAPEISGLISLWRIAGPPGLAVLGVAPLVFARKAWNDTGKVEDVLTAINTPWFVVMAFGSWALLWVRYGPRMSESLQMAGARTVRGPEVRKV